MSPRSRQNEETFHACSMCTNGMTPLKVAKGAGTTFLCLGVTLKSDANVIWKNWDGKKVNTVLVNDDE